MRSTPARCGGGARTARAGRSPVAEESPSGDGERKRWRRSSGVRAKNWSARKKKGETLRRSSPIYNRRPSVGILNRVCSRSVRRLCTSCLVEPQAGHTNLNRRGNRIRSWHSGQVGINHSSDNCCDGTASAPLLPRCAVKGLSVHKNRRGSRACGFHMPRTIDTWK